MVRVLGVRQELLRIKKAMKDHADKQLPIETKAIERKLVENTPIDTGHARRGWKSDGRSISNDVEYIDKLNRGSSEQAPAYFIEKTVLAHRGVTPSGIIVRKTSTTR